MKAPLYKERSHTPSLIYQLMVRPSWGVSVYSVDVQHDMSLRCTWKFCGNPIILLSIFFLLGGWESERGNEWVGGTINVTTFTYTNMLHHVMQLQEPSRLGAHRSTDCASHCRCGQSHLNQNQHTLHVTIWWRRGSKFSQSSNSISPLCTFL